MNPSGRGERKVEGVERRGERRERRRREEERSRRGENGLRRVRSRGDVVFPPRSL